MSQKITHKIKKKDRITTYHSHRVLLKGVTEECPISRDLPDGKYIILQSRTQGESVDASIPVLAFEVDSGNFRITSISGERDVATLAAELWHLQFTSKQKTALRTLKILKKELARMQRDLETRISRDGRYRLK